MKILLIAPFAIATLFFEACEQKSAQITSSSPAPAPFSTSTQATEAPDYSGLTSPSLAEAAPSPQASSSASQSASPVRPVFKTEAATEAANQYLNSYQAVIQDLNEVPTSPPVPPPGGIYDVRPSLQKFARDTAALANLQKQVDAQLNPEEKRRLRQYQKNLAQGAQDAN
jgi:hypothetical protein